MNRAYMTAAVSVILVVVIGMTVVLLGLIYPSRRVIAAGSYLWARAVLWCAGVRLVVHGLEHIRDGRARFLVGNHQSGLDIPIVISLCRGNVRFLAKDSLFRIPIFGWALHRYRYIPIDRSRTRVTLRNVDRALGYFRRRPVSLAVFPEGTRSRNGVLLPFRRGAVKIGQRTGMDIVPFAIDGSMAVNHPDVFRAVPGPVRVSFMRPIPADEAAALSPGELHDRVRAGVLRGLDRAAIVPEHMAKAEWQVANGK